jgi:hypothetical protein
VPWKRQYDTFMSVKLVQQSFISEESEQRREKRQR